MSKQEKQRKTVLALCQDGPDGGFKGSTIERWCQGEIVEFRTDSTGFKACDPYPVHFAGCPEDYRIKPRKRARPYNMDEFAQVWKTKNTNMLNRHVAGTRVGGMYIRSADLSGVNTTDGLRPSYRSLCDEYTWPDGEPCGVVEENEDGDVHSVGISEETKVRAIELPMGASKEEAIAAVESAESPHTFGWRARREDVLDLSKRRTIDNRLYALVLFKRYLDENDNPILSADG